MSLGLEPREGFGGATGGAAESNVPNGRFTEAESPRVPTSLSVDGVDCAPTAPRFIVPRPQRRPPELPQGTHNATQNERHGRRSVWSTFMVSLAL